MQSIKRLLKFQFISYFKSLIISLLVGILVTLIANLFFKTIANESYKLSEFLVMSGFILILVSTIVLIIQCFMCFYEDYRFSTRLGITRKNFFVANLIFMTMLILIYTLVFSGVLTTGIGYFEEIADLIDLEYDFEEANMTEEMFYRQVEIHQKRLMQEGYFAVFPIVLTSLLAIVAFWLLIGFIIFSLNMKGLIVIIPLIILLGIVRKYLPINGLLESFLIFVISQTVLFFGIKRVSESV